MNLFIGLGNPDEYYQPHRHNLGKNIILKICQNLQVKINKKSRLQAYIAKYQNSILGHTATFMNDSGLSVRKILNFYKIDPQNLYIIHDDLDLGVGDYKIQFDRGHAGHNGIKSIINSLRTQAFHRIRIGISHPQDNTPIESYVLKPFLPKELVIIKDTIDKIIPQVEKLINSS